MDQEFSIEAARDAFERLLMATDKHYTEGEKSERTYHKNLRWEEFERCKIGTEIDQVTIPFRLKNDLFLKTETGEFESYTVFTSLIVIQKNEEYTFEVFVQIADEECWDENYEYSFNRIEITEDLFGNLKEALYFRNGKVGRLVSDHSGWDVAKHFAWYACQALNGFRTAAHCTLLYEETFHFKWLPENEKLKLSFKMGPNLGSVWVQDSVVTENTGIFEDEDRKRLREADLSNLDGKVLAKAREILNVIYTFYPKGVFISKLYKYNHTPEFFHYKSFSLGTQEKQREKWGDFKVDLASYLKTVNDSTSSDFTAGILPGYFVPVVVKRDTENAQNRVMLYLMISFITPYWAFFFEDSTSPNKIRYEVTDDFEGEIIFEIGKIIEQYFPGFEYLSKEIHQIEIPDIDTLSTYKIPTIFNAIFRN